MNETRFFPLVLLSLFGAVLALAGCGQASGPPPLEGASIGGPFTLTSHEGKRVSWSDFDGRYRIVYFGFTFCPDVCPVDLQTVSAGLRRFESDAPARAEKVVPIFITVDPSRDTPEEMAKYIANFHPRLVGLTGSEEEIAQAKDAFRVFAQRSGPADSPNYLVDHSRIIYLFGPEGQPIAMLPHDQGPAAFAAELDRWVR